MKRRMRWTVLHLCWAALAAQSCAEGEEPDDMATTSDPAAYCRSHPDAMPDCNGLDHGACEAHPFCDPFDAIPCAGDGPEDWVEMPVSCQTTRGCIDTALDYAPPCSPVMTFAHPAESDGGWYLFYSNCIPDGWVTSKESDMARFLDACGELSKWYP
jgi:hypothetical protein